MQALPTMERLQAILPFAAIDDGAAFDTRAATVVRPVGILHLLAAAATSHPAHKSQRLRRRWRAAGTCVHRPRVV